MVRTLNKICGRVQVALFGLSKFLVQRVSYIHEIAKERHRANITRKKGT